jgi:Tfp pilus assembly protein PilN
MEVGVCHDGQLLLDYRPGGRSAVVDLPSLLETHLNRLGRHVGRYLRCAPPELRHIYLCGDGEAVEKATRQFKRHSKLSIRHVRPADVKATWRLDAAVVGDATAAALGGLLATYMPEGHLDAPNLMQHIINCKREPLRPTLIRSAAPLAAMLLVMAALSYVNARSERTLTTMQSELDTLAIAEARATELRLQLLASKSKLAQLEKLAALLPAELGDDLIKRLAACMPSDVWLSRLEVVDCSTIRLQGSSYLEAGVYDFVRWLEQAPGLAEVALKGTAAASSIAGPTTSFELEVTLTHVNQPPSVEAKKIAAHPTDNAAAHVAALETLPVAKP